MTSSAEKRRFRKIVLFSIGINLLMWILSLFCCPSWEANDDITMQGLLYGIYGESTSNLIYMSRMWGIILCLLIKLPFNVYIMAQVFAILLSSSIVSVVFIERFGKKGLLSVMIWCAAVFECYISLQYTKTAGLVTAAGIMGILYFVIERRDKVMTVLSGALILIGYMIRSESALLAGALCLPIILVNIFGKGKSKKDIIRTMIVPVLVIGILIGGCSIFDVFKRNSAEQERLLSRYEYYRQRLSDYHSDMNTAKLVRALSDEGKTDLLYEVCMADCWMQNDPLVFTADKLQELDEMYADEASPAVSEVVSKTLSIFLYNLRGTPMLIMMILIQLLAIAFSDKRIYPILSCILYFLTQGAMVYVGRYNLHRVTYIIILVCLMSTLYICGVPAIGSKRKDLNKILFVVVAVILVEVSVATVFMIIRNVRSNLEENTDRYSCYLEIADPDEYYMYYPTSGPAYDPSVSIYSIPQKGKDAYPLGGWDSCFNYSDGVIQHEITGNPFVECIDSDNIRILMPADDDGYNIKLLEGYIMTHYGVNVEETLERSNEFYAVYSLHSVE